MEREEEGTTEANIMISVDDVPCEEKLVHNAPQ